MHACFEGDCVKQWHDVCMCAGAVTTAATSHQFRKWMMKGVIENEGATVFINAK